MASGEYNVVVAHRILQEVFLADTLSVFFQSEDDLCAAEILFILICCQFRFSTEGSGQVARYLEYSSVPGRYLAMNCYPYTRFEMSCK